MIERQYLERSASAESSIANDASDRVASNATGIYPLPAHNSPRHRLYSIEATLPAKLLCWGFITERKADEGMRARIDIVRSSTD